MNTTPIPQADLDAVKKRIEQDIKTGRAFMPQASPLAQRYGLDYAQSKRAAIKKQREVTMEEIKTKIDRETLFLFAYVPFVIAEVAWDYADSCLNMAVLLRQKELKPLCRAIKELRRDYDRLRQRAIDRQHREIENEQMILFQEDYKEFFSKLHLNITSQVSNEHPGLCTDSRMLISAAYSCAVVLRSLFKYAGIMEKRIADILGITAIGSIIVKELRQLDKLILHFAGEDSIGSNNRFPDSLNIFVDTLTNYMLQSEMIELPCPTDND
ncbi:MAG: hypothetical protein NC044_05575 [Prevotella sp.]|nr:hypothetical protein [Lachnospiraceae bacterium]MCM1379540.1 hypothetical protein [Bacteroides sp.]MCM1445857.1 hypothetical protein [Prevotella sp.]